MDNIVFSVTIVTGNYKSILQKIDDQHEMWTEEKHNSK
jgi:hypothetical protein